MVADVDCIKDWIYRFVAWGLLSTLRGYGRNQHTAGDALKLPVKVRELWGGQAEIPP